MGKWEFNRLGDSETEHNPRESEFFKTHEIYEALVRETVQNSVDAVDDETKPVKLVFSFKSIAGLSAGPYCAAPIEHFKATPGLSVADDVLAQNKCLLIEDYNTSGLDGELARVQGAKSNYRAFWFGEGISQKEEGAGGRWGVGKTVYSMSSQIRAFWGATKRKSDSQAIVTGRALLKPHWLGGIPYTYYGTYGCSDEQAIANFKKHFGVDRETSGLSIVVPFVSPRITLESVARAIVMHCAYAVLSGCVEIFLKEDGGDKFAFTKSTIKGLAANIRWTEEDDEWQGRNGGEIIDFMTKAQAVDEAQLVTLTNPDAYRIVEDKMFPDLKSLQAKYNAGEFIGLKVPVKIKTKNGEKKDAFYKVFIQNVPGLLGPEEFYLRSSVLISEIKRVKAPVRAMLVVDDGPLSAFLGDAEEPAHTKWDPKSDNFVEKYINDRATLRYIEHSLKDILSILVGKSIEPDRDFLKDIFFVPNEPQAGKPKGNNPPPPPPPPPPNPKPFRVSSDAHNNIVVHPSKGITAYPVVAAISFTYRSRGTGKRYMPLDFNLADTAKFPMLMKNGRIVELQNGNNTVKVEMTSADAELSVSGFDLNRDLIVEAKKVN